MLFDLDDETRLLQRTVREFAEGEVAPVAEELDRTKSFPYELVTKMAGLGWMGIPFPEEVGGAGGTTLQYAIAVEELSRVDSSLRSRCAPTLPSAPSRSTCSAPRSRSSTICRTWSLDASSALLD